jgi:hypothetical protein
MVNQAGNEVKGLRDGSWEIIFGQEANRVRNTSGKGMLFNLKSDPFETTNLWGRHPERVEVIEKLWRKMQAAED